MCSGLLRLRGGLHAGVPGHERFRGRIVHPQKWPEDLDYTGKRVVVIGSGATAVTLVPAMAEEAAHVTMLQRSPTYVVARPAEDRDRQRLRRHPAAKLAYGMTRWKNVLFGMYFLPALPAQAGSRQGADPRGVRWRWARLRRRDALHAALQPVGPAAVPGARRRPVPGDPGRQRVGRHRPDRDLHRDGHPPEVRQELEADIIVTATGLELKLLGGVDGRRRRPRDRSRRHADLQGHDVQRRARTSLGVRLHQRLVDAESAAIWSANMSAGFSITCEKEQPSGPCIRHSSTLPDMGASHGSTVGHRRPASMYIRRRSDQIRAPK